jgi:hypothetical protein
MQHDKRGCIRASAIEQMDLPPGHIDETAPHGVTWAAWRAASHPKASPRISDTPAW